MYFSSILVANYDEEGKLLFKPETEDVVSLYSDCQFFAIDNSSGYILIYSNESRTQFIKRIF